MEGVRYPFLLALVVCDGPPSSPPLGSRQNISLASDLEGQGLVIKTRVLALVGGHQSPWPYAQEMRLCISSVWISCC